MTASNASAGGASQGPATTGQAKDPRLAGLSDEAAAERLRRDGPNTLPDPDRRGPLKIVAEVVREPMFALLIAGGLVYLALGDLKEALMLLAFANVSVLVTVVQELRSERVLEALKDLTSPGAQVVRDGRTRRIPGAEVVVGDLMMVSEGDRVPADAVLVAGGDLELDEALLTGESLPVQRRPAAPGGEGASASAVRSGTLVVRGQGWARVVATGPRSEIGRIGQSLRSVERDAPRLSVQIRKLVRIVALVGLVTCASVVLITGLTQGQWLKGALGGIALGMALLPEEFPLVLTVFMVMGAWRISQSRVLTRRADAIETLGSATVLCTDKTGTLTQNRMSVAAAWADGETFEFEPSAQLPGPAMDLARIGALASAEQPFDPMETAFHTAVGGWRPAGVGLKLHRVWGMQPGRPAVTQAWTGDDGEPGLIALKGAPEAVARLCRLPEDEEARVLAAAAAFARRGMRVLAVARAEHDPKVDHSGPETMRLDFQGLIALADPIRADVPQAVDDSQRAGIRVVLVTGDHPGTARAIADQAGIAPGEVLTGADLDRLSDPALAAAASRASIFARVRPEQKLRIVQALKSAGEVVAMTGDGVNDAPALKAADIGVAMGERGSDVAREAASLVLLDDDFGSIVRAVRLGRRIYDNLEKALGFIVAVHVPLVFMALAPLLLGLPTVLAPVHIAFIELIIDPACSLAFEAEREEGDVMRRPPRNPKRPLFSAERLAWAAAQGVVAALVVAGVYFLCVRQGLPSAAVRTTSFLALVVVDVGLILVNRTATASLAQAVMRPNPWLWPIVGAAAIILAAAIAVPGIGELFEFGHTTLPELALGLGFGVGGFLLLMALQYARLTLTLRRRRTSVTNP